MKVRALPALAVALLAATACASGGMGTSGMRDILTAQDIAASGAQTAYEAVQRLQPNWLTTRGASSVNSSGPEQADVYFGGVNMGGPQYLQSVLASEVKELHYYDAGQAATRFGMGHPRGVIELTLK